MRQFFQTKYKVLPVYNEMKKCGVIVYARPWYSPVYMCAVLDTMTSKGELTTTFAYFKTTEEAMEFIKDKKQVC